MSELSRHYRQLLCLDEQGRLDTTITSPIEPVDRLDGTIRYERLGDDLRSVLEADVELSAAYHDPVELAEWYGDDRIRDLATAWGQADRLRFGY